MKRSLLSQSRGFTFVEMMVSSALVGVVVMFMGSYLSLSSLLFAKNASTNLTHQSIRSSIDKIVQDVTAANSAVSLITTTGTAVTTGAAAGVRFDSLIGTPYIVVHPSTGPGVAATATSLTIQRTTTAGLAPPIPQAGNVLLLDGAPSVRLKVASVTTGSTDGSGVQTMTVTLSSAPGTAITWDSSRVKSARLVRPVAYVVIPTSGSNELRFYNSAEAIVDFTTATQYALVIKNVGIATGDSTPFSFITSQGKSFLDIIFRVRSDRFDNRLSTKEKNEASAIQRVEFIVNPRNI